MNNRIYLWLFVTGLAIGAAQLFYVRTLTVEKTTAIADVRPGQATCLAISPECGACPGEAVNGICYEGAYKQDFRGFPLKSGSYGAQSQTDITAALYLNVALFALGLPLTGFVFTQIHRKLSR